MGSPAKRKVIIFPRQEPSAPGPVGACRNEALIASGDSMGGCRVHQDQKPMTRDEFLLQMDEILGLQPGTLRGDEKLEDLENWDSTALVSLIVLADASNSVSIAPDQVVDCSTVADLLRLAQVEDCPSGRSAASRCSDELSKGRISAAELPAPRPDPV
jgi:acyl carrier protein